MCLTTFRSSPRSRRSCFPSPGFGPLTAAKLVGEIAGAGRFASDAKLARAAGVAPTPVSSGKTNRHRLDRGGNRQINATIHRHRRHLRCHAETQDYIARKRAAGKNTKEAIRCLKRHLARRLWHLLQTSRPAPSQTITPSTACPSEQRKQPRRENVRLGGSGETASDTE